MKTTSIHPSVALILAAAALTGCNPLPTDLLDALPSDEAITLRVPGGASGFGGGGVFQPLLGAPSEYHGQVVQISTVVNANVVELVRRIRGVAAYPPNKQVGNTSTWGPYSPGGLDNLNYRFVAVKHADASYTIKLEARPASSAADADFKALIDGDIQGILGGQGGRGTGHFTVHLDNRAALDANVLARGELSITYDNSADPRKIDVDLHGFDPLSETDDETAPAAADASYRYSEALDKAGSFLLAFSLNVQDGSLPAAERVVLQSRWDASGRGRGDASISGDDVVAQLQQAGLTGDVINATECWDEAFNVVFQDTTPAELRGSLKDLQGDPAACAFTAADYPAQQ